MRVIEIIDKVSISEYFYQKGYTSFIVAHTTLMTISWLVILPMSENGSQDVNCLSNRSESCHACVHSITPNSYSQYRKGFHRLLKWTLAIQGHMIKAQEAYEYRFDEVWVSMD